MPTAHARPRWIVPIILHTFGGLANAASISIIIVKTMVNNFKEQISHQGHQFNSDLDVKLNTFYNVLLSQASCITVSSPCTMSQRWPCQTRGPPLEQRELAV